MAIVKEFKLKTGATILINDSQFAGISEEENQRRIDKFLSIVGECYIRDAQKKAMAKEKENKKREGSDHNDSQGI